MFSIESRNAVIERRAVVRQKMRAPIFAVFDVTRSGMILDLSEQGLSLLAPALPEANRPISVKLSLFQPCLEVTAYVAWTDALNRAGIRFLDLPGDARFRLQEWLSVNEAKPSQNTPKFALDESLLAELQTKSAEIETVERPAIDFEKDSDCTAQTEATQIGSVQLEFISTGSELDVALHDIAERAQSLTRATGAALALASDGLLTCRASVGTAAPAVGATVDVSSGFSGGCVRTGITVRCDDAASDPRVDASVCRGLAIRSIVASPIHYDRNIVGLLEVFSTHPFAFDGGDVAVVERLARTTLASVTKVARLI